MPPNATSPERRPLEMERPTRATSYDVARMAGVSQSAVSRAFRDGGSISPNMRAKVEEAARALGYAPSRIARSLITRRSGLIGVVTAELTSRNYPDLNRRLGEDIQASGGRMLLAVIAHDDDADAAAADMLSFHVDGIVSTAHLSQETLLRCARAGVPVVLYNRVPRGGGASAVGCDHYVAMDALVDHLLAGGVGRAVYIAGPADAPVSRDRLSAAVTAFAARGLSLAAVVHGDYSHDTGRALVTANFEAWGRPDTILCANDTTAFGAIDALRFDLGVAVPDTVAVTGFDDVVQAAWPSFDLTTLRQPLERMTAMTVRLLRERIDGASEGGERRLMPAELKVRGTTRRPPASS